MSDAGAIFCALAVAASVLRLAYVIRTAPERPYTLHLRWSEPGVINHAGRVEHTYRHDEPKEPWQGDEQP